MSPEKITFFEQLTRALDASSSVIVCGHTDPDGDALGSVLALALSIEQEWPGVAVYPLLANNRQAPETFAFLPSYDRLIQASSFKGSCDVFIALDTPNHARLRDAYDVLRRCKTSVCLDHHPHEEDFATYSYTDCDASSVGDLVYDFLLFRKSCISSDVATCLLTAIITDTGRFQYQNTNAHALRAAARLVEAGAVPSDICLHVYQSKSQNELKLTELTLQRLVYDTSRGLAFSYVLQEDLVRLGASAAQCSELVNVVRSLDGPQAVFFLRQTVEGSFKGSFRAKSDECDVSVAARALGGGGHKGAAGFTVAGPLERALDEILAAYDAYLSSLDVQVVSS